MIKRDLQMTLRLNLRRTELRPDRQMKRHFHLADFSNFLDLLNFRKLTITTMAGDSPATSPSLQREFELWTPNGPAAKLGAQLNTFRFCSNFASEQPPNRVRLKSSESNHQAAGVMHIRGSKPTKSPRSGRNDLQTSLTSTVWIFEIERQSCRLLSKESESALKLDN